MATMESSRRKEWREAGPAVHLLRNARVLPGGPEPGGCVMAVGSGKSGAEMGWQLVGKLAVGRLAGLACS
jgi:hypothetical protein